MSYLVLARKWRPQTFEQMRGQDHIVRALRNAIDSGRIAHAYIFTGTRGVGKTTAARVLANARHLAACLQSQGLEIVTGGTGGSGRVIGRALELSSVDLAQEFISLISAQTGFSANSRIISTSDQLIQELLMSIR